MILEKSKKKKRYIPSYENQKRGLLNKLLFWKRRSYKPSYDQNKKGSSIPSYSDGKGSLIGELGDAYYEWDLLQIKIATYVVIPLLIIFLVIMFILIIFS
jgi:hypothetical protein